MIMTEWEKTFDDKFKSGFFAKYMSGDGLDIGYRGYEEAKPIIANAIGIDIGYPGYNGINLPFESNSKDFIYSSHCLEHIDQARQAINEWFRVVKPNGYIITVVPHKDLYEKKEDLPSRFNPDHKRFYTPASLLREFEDYLPSNSFRVRHMQDNDAGHDYNQPAEEHSKWLYEIELIVQKL